VSKKGIKISLDCPFKNGDVKNFSGYQYLEKEGAGGMEMTGLTFSFPVLNVLWDMVAGHTFSR
jgi:hypothetical protein